MGIVPTNFQLKKEDYDQKDQGLIEQFAPSFNYFVQQVIAALNGNITFENLNQNLITLKVKVDINGKPNVLTQFKTSLKSKVAGLVCVSATNLTAVGTPPNSQPFITFTVNNNLCVINYISGIQSGDQYSLTLLVIGS